MSILPLAKPRVCRSCCGATKDVQFSGGTVPASSRRSGAVEAALLSGSNTRRRRLEDYRQRTGTRADIRDGN